MKGFWGILWKRRIEWVILGISVVWSRMYLNEMRAKYVFFQ